MIGIILVFLVSDTLKINLDQAKEIALKGNPTYQVQTLSHTYNKLGLYENLASDILNPAVGITYSEATFGDYSYPSSPVSPSQGGKGYNFSFSLNQPVFDFGKASSILQSKFSTNASLASSWEAENLLYYQVEGQYLTVLKVEKLLGMRNKAIERAEENMRFVTKRLELGKASRLDFLNATVYLNRAKLDLSDTRKNYTIAKRLLLNILGLRHQCELLLEPVEIEDGKFELPELNILITTSIENRPKIKAAYEEVKEARLGVWSSFFSFLPQISFKWSWNYNTENFPDKFSTIRNGATKNTGWYATANLNLFSYPFEVWKTKTILDKTNLNLLNERLIVVKEVEEARLDCLTMNENLKLAKSMFEAAREGNALAKTQYKLGLIPILDLFQIETDLLDAEATYISALYDYKLARTKLKYVIGGKL
ncbi:TolC family protein [candidate division WOR-3 bacterium]|nr:TolC family protein [candidate division WOR-3 bacterium]